MKFGKKIRSLMVPEWREFYMNYKILKVLLSTYKLMGKLEGIQDEGVQISNYTAELKELEQFNQHFEQVLLYELKKVSTFYHHRLDQLISKWRRLKINAILVKISKAREDYEEKKLILKNAFEIYYKEIRLLSQFIKVNLEGFQKILKKYRKVTQKFLNPEVLKGRYEVELRNRRLTSHRDYVQNLVVHIEQDYIEIFYKPNQRKLGQYELKKIYQGKLISQSESFLFGLFISVVIACIFLAFTLTWICSISVEDDPEFKGVLPAFRGSGLLIVYFWLLGLCVYAWSEFNINYKLIFGFGHHYSTVPEIFRRVSFFSAVYLAMILWFIIIRQEVGDINSYIDFLPMRLTPLVVWIVMIGYILFPSRDVFNFPGRYYVFNLCKELFFSLFSKSNFRSKWAAEQLTSFIIPLKDLHYTYCYYTSNEEDTDECGSLQNYSFVIYIFLVPFVIRFIQSVRQIFEYEEHHKKLIYSGNSLKYLLTILLGVVSYFAVKNNDHTLMGFWFVFAFIVVLYNIIWDVKFDFGFLESFGKNKYLRELLAINNPMIYYAFVAVTFVLRFFWVFALCPNLLIYFDESESMIFYVGLLEIIRRGVWNFIRIEREHVYNCGFFKACDTFSLPYEDVQIDFDESLLFFGELYSVMHSDNAHPDAEAPDTKAAATPKFDRVKSVNSNNLNQALRKAIMEKAKDAEWIRNLNLDTILDADFDPEELKQEVKAFKKRILEKSNDFAINIEEMKKK